MDRYIDELKQIINNEEQRMLDIFISEQRAIIELVKAMDYFFIIANYLDGKSKIPPRIIEYYNACWPYPIKLFYDDINTKREVSIDISNAKVSGWADITLQQSGKINMIKKLISMQKSGFYSLSKSPTKRNFIFTLNPVKITGAEYFERLELKKYFKVIKNAHEETFNGNKKKELDILKKMHNMCDIMDADFGYRKDSIIDSFFLEKAHLESIDMLSINEIPDFCLINGIKYEVYKTALLHIISWSLRHINWCFALLKKYPNENLRDIIIMVKPKETVINNISKALSISFDDAENILNNLALNSDNIGYYCNDVQDATAPFIEIAENQFLYSITGSLVNPFLFMLKEMKRKYNKDYGNAENKREDLLRNELYMLFNNSNLIKIQRNFKLAGTDIDACIIDPENGYVAFFQIKDQQPYGSMMAKRDSTKKNFMEECNPWIHKIFSWLENNKIESLSSYLGLRMNILKKIKEVRVFVLGRYSAHFSGNESPDERVAWGLWPQVVNKMEECHNCENPIEYLYTTLKNDSPIKKVKKIIHDEYVIDLPNTQIIVRSHN